MDDYKLPSEPTHGSVTVFAETSNTRDSIGVSKNGKVIHKATSKDMAQGE
jgi:hypothetical protein